MEQGNLVKPFQLKLKETIDKFEKDVMQKKKLNFSRDRLDFDRGNAYRWTHKGKKRTPGNNPTRDSTMKSASASLSSYFFKLVDKRSRHRTQRGKRKRDPSKYQEKENQISGVDITPESGKETGIIQTHPVQIPL